VPVEATISGPYCRLTLRVHRYEYPTTSTGPDANRLVADAELSVGTTGLFSGSHRLSLHVPDLKRFVDELRALDRDLTGEAKLEHAEDQLAVTIALAAGKGTLAGHLREEVGATLSFSHMPTDQTYVREALGEFTALTAAFPTR
jgi:hypothetical protein